MRTRLIRQLCRYIFAGGALTKLHSHVIHNCLEYLCNYLRQCHKFGSKKQNLNIFYIENYIAASKNSTWGTKLAVHVLELIFPILLGRKYAPSPLPGKSVSVIGRGRGRHGKRQDLLN
jgi:hypothetical protein